MHDEMMDLLADDDILRDRLATYATMRLSPSLTATSRVRARVLAVAHRQAALAGADAALTLLPEPDRRMGHVSTRRRRGTTQRRSVALVLAASLTLVSFVGTAFAARPGGPLYDARLFVEQVVLPSESSARAVAELERLHQRLVEAAAASAGGDSHAAAAALAAYERILTEATSAARATGDDVATAALHAGSGANVVVLQALLATLPDRAGEAIARSIERAIQRSNDAVRSMSGSGPTRGGPGGNDGSSGGGVDPATGPTTTTTPARTPKPAKTPKPAGSPGSSPGHAKPTPDPDATPRPTLNPASSPGGGKPTPGPDATPRPTPRASTGP